MSPSKASPRYLFFGGKGGVGKTTCAVAAAKKAAASGRRVLIVSTDPAHSLGDALETRLSARLTKVKTKRGSLYAVELDADKALERWIAKRKRTLQAIAEHGTYLDADDIEKLLRLSLPGVDEIVGLVELRRLASVAKCDEVIVDTAPTGHTLRLLTMPETLRRFAGVFDDMQAKDRFLRQSLGGRLQPDASDELIEEIDSEGRELTEILTDPELAAFTWVMLPEMVVLEETKDAIAALAAQRITIGEIVVNRVAQKPKQPCAACRRRIAGQRIAIRAIGAAFPKVAIRVEPEFLDEGPPLKKPIPKLVSSAAAPLEVLARADADC